VCKEAYGCPKRQGKENVSEVEKRPYLVLDSTAYLYSMIAEAEVNLGHPVIIPREHPSRPEGVSEEDSEELDDEISVHYPEGVEGQAE
jgi:diadenosine tetraphosphate (Ap4A) HIT family hydrolase